MPSVCKIALKAPLAPVVDCVETYLRSRGLACTVEETPWPAAVERREPTETFPRTLSVRQVTAQVCEIHVDTFNRMDSLASLLSRRIVVPVVVNVYRSDTRGGYWALHANSRVARSIAADDGVVVAYTGERLAFESEEPGRADAGGTLMLFDDAEQDRYNREVGVPVELHQAFGAPWRNYVLDAGAREPERAPAAKPWWRFW